MPPFEKGCKQDGPSPAPRTWPGRFLTSEQDGQYHRPNSRIFRVLPNCSGKLTSTCDAPPDPAASGPSEREPQQGPLQGSALSAVVMDSIRLT
ncbi:hypothetical protein TREES_T100006256 [Tupaia chinensis]|uniref:Uncharacterized protein n=1 Tax=Tupaia chinensis TaxID=246437 RepID=L9L8V0_TUPCH|nr:hypothetical protein TREES_T100006256 [Tupaia chinensis]